MSDGITDLGNDRVSIPLMMLRGNLECLLDNEIEVTSISLRRHDVDGVVLIINATPGQSIENEKKGFRTKKIEEAVE